jgi:hypothetical protein
MFKTDRRREPDRSAACTHEDQMPGGGAVYARSLDIYGGRVLDTTTGRGHKDLTPPCMCMAHAPMLACMHMHVQAMHLRTSKQGGRGHASTYRN